MQIFLPTQSSKMRFNDTAKASACFIQLKGFSFFLQRVNHIALVINRRPFTCHLLILKGVPVTSCNWLSSFLICSYLPLHGLNMSVFLCKSC